LTRSLNKNFFRRPLGLWAVTLTAAAGLLALGYLTAYEVLSPRLQQMQRLAAAEASRANRLAAENRQLEERLARLSQAPAGPPSETGAKQPGALSGVLHKGRAAIVLEGRVVLTLDSISPQGRQAAIKVQVLGGREGTAVLGPGASVGLKVDGEVFYLVVKAVHTSSVLFALVPK
jgi:hypothetical protein